MRTSAKTSSSIERVSVKNAFNPILWVCGLISAPATVACGFAANPSWLLTLLALGPVAVAAFSYLYLLFVDPDRLQSESFQLRKQALELIEEKGTFGVIDASTIEVISNPDLPALPSPRDEVGK
ncbi:MAG: hypothetical protein IT516_17785 [Burkholderiales bacterium]|nr:hypothetical protein [Burkholderiales bacterium]